MNDAHGLSIELASKAAGLMAVLINRSAAAVLVLADARLQPAQLKLVSAAGRKQPYTDSREVMKFDNTPHCRLFHSIGPGQRLALGSVQFAKTPGGFAGSFGPFEFEKVPAGDYQAQVTWRSELDACFDEDTRQMRKLPGAFVGVLRSNDVTLTLR